MHGKGCVKLNQLFVYGTLRNRSTLEWVIGHQWDSEYEDAILKGYYRVGPILIVERSGFEVAGKLVRNLSDEDLLNLDHYEGIYDGKVGYTYQRKEVDVTVGDKTVKAFAYPARNK